MATKIVLCSDNHGSLEPIFKILEDNPQADYYFHCGDLCNNLDSVKPFVVVKGNNDYEDLEKERIFEIEGHKILMIHGSGLTYSVKLLIDKAKSKDCDILFFGHTHMFYDEKHNGVRLINPGSCFFNRDYSTPCYAIVTIDNEEINVEKIELY